MIRSEHTYKPAAMHMLVLAFGLFAMAMGIALCIRAGLGITPISCPPYVLSLGLPFSVGQFTFAMHVLLIIGQKLLLRSEFKRVQWLQLVLALAFGCFIDGCMLITEAISPDGYAMRIIVLLAGNALLALGMHFEMKARLILVPTDGFVQAACRRSGMPFHRLKIAFDVSLLLISVACSAALLGRIEGIREGTLISAFLVGFLNGIIRKISSPSK